MKIIKTYKKFIDIDKITNIVYIGNIIEKKSKSKGRWKIEYACDRETRKKENGRIYFIVIDGEIYKIGCSECKGGIQNTLLFYESGLSGSPSLRSFGVHILIQEQINLRKDIKIYALFIEPIKVVINGLSSSVEKITYPQIKEMENLCREDYKIVYGRYPKWNFQENNNEFPEHIKTAYKTQVNNR